MPCYMDAPHCYYNCEAKADGDWYQKVYDQLRIELFNSEHGGIGVGTFKCPTCGTVMDVSIISEPKFDCRVKEKHKPDEVPKL